MFFYEGMTCPVCEHRFKPTDDIVACPYCGLPHHRACWQHAGHCHLQHLHDTPEQWTRSKAVECAEAPENETTTAESTQSCPRCGAENPEFAEYCKRCGNILRQPDWHSITGADPFEYTPFIATAGNSTDYVCPEGDHIEDIPTKQYAAIVGTKADYYIPRFKRLASAKAGGWNWAAFIFGPYWLLYRKMYAGGILFLLMQLFETVVNGYVLDRLGIATVEQLYKAFETAVNDRTQMLYLLSIWLLSVIIILLRVVIGLGGNSFYKQHCTREIQRARNRIPDISAAELATYGGTTFGVALIGYCAIYFLTQLVAVFFM